MAVILISRGTMSGGMAIAKCLAETLRLECVSREELVSRVDAQGSYAHKMVESLHKASRAYEQFSRDRRPYVIFMKLALLEYIRRDNVVYHGYSGHLLAPELPCCLKVRINAPMSLRLKNAMRSLKLPEEEAQEAIVKADEERVRWARFMYGRDIRDPNLYDACFYKGKLSTGAICAMIGGCLDRPELARTPEAEKAIEDIFLAARVEAALVSNENTRYMEIGAKAKEGALLLEGPYMEKGDLAKVKEVAGAIPGVKDVEYQPGCPPSFQFTQSPSG